MFQDGLMSATDKATAKLLCASLCNFVFGLVTHPPAFFNAGEDYFTVYRGYEFYRRFNDLHDSASRTGLVFFAFVALRRNMLARRPKMF
jgi:hypothetical protein